MAADFVKENIFFDDSATTGNEMVQELRLKSLQELQPRELCMMSTYVDPAKIDRDMRNNPYLQELCRRAGNLEKFLNGSFEESMKARNGAAKQFGVWLV